MPHRSDRLADTEAVVCATAPLSPAAGLSEAGFSWFLQENFAPGSLVGWVFATMNVYGDAVSADMAESHSKTVGLAFNGTEMARKPV
jgi:hypothetical protein